MKDKFSNIKNEKDFEKPPAYTMFPTSMRIKKIDPITNAVIPSEEAVEDVKRWVDYNTK